MDIQEIDLAYKTTEKVSRQGWQVNQVNWTRLSKFSQCLSAFRKLILELDIKAEWDPVLRTFYIVRHHLSSSPLSFRDSLKLVNSSHDDYIKQLLSSSPRELQQLYQDLNQSFLDLYNDIENPLWAHTKQLIDKFTDKEAQIAFLCHSIRSIPSHYTFYKKHLPQEISNYWVISPTELRQLYLYDHLVVFGSPKSLIERNFQYIFTSPRADNLWLFLPSGTIPELPSPYGLAGSAQRRHHSQRGENVGNFSPATFIGNTSPPLDTLYHDEDCSIDFDDSEDVNSIINILVDRESTKPESSEMVSAYRINLSSHKIVLISTSGSATRLQINTEKYTCEDVETADCASINTDDILLFSTSGGGDMITELGKQLLINTHGELLADSFHYAQLQWKSALKNYIFKHGVKVTLSNLEKLGSKFANEINIRNWISTENIAPGAWRSFDAVLRLCQLDSNKELFHQAVAEIRKARHKAGFQLANKLRDDLYGQSLKKLIDSGEQDFGGTSNMPNIKTAYFVEDVSRSSVEVPRQLLNTPITLPYRLWRY